MICPPATEIPKADLELRGKAANVAQAAEVRPWSYLCLDARVFNTDLPLAGCRAIVYDSLWKKVAPLATCRFCYATQ